MFEVCLLINQAPILAVHIHITSWPGFILPLLDLRGGLALMGHIFSSKVVQQSDRAGRLENKKSVQF